MKEKVTFKIFEFDRLNMRKYKEITLNIKSIKTICCGGVGCTIYYKNGKSRLLYWYTDDIKMALDELIPPTNKAFWFDDETYDIFWEWYKQFPFDDICEELELF